MSASRRRGWRTRTLVSRLVSDDFCAAHTMRFVPGAHIRVVEGGRGGGGSGRYFDVGWRINFPFRVLCIVVPTAASRRASFSVLLGYSR